MLKSFFSFSGRLNRKPYWLMTLAVTVTMILAVFVMVGLVSIDVGNVGTIVAAAIFLPAIVSSLSIAVRRLHDRDKSGWWMLLFYIVPGIAQGIGEQMGEAGLVLILISFGISIWALVELGFLKGTNGPNRYGPDPLTGANADPAIFE